jgi:hypothetical protein
MTSLIKWVRTGGVLLVSIALVWIERDRGRYVYCKECVGILDTRTGTIYSGDNLSPQKIGGPEPYWNRKALTARFEKADCEPGDIDFQADTNGSLHTPHIAGIDKIARIDDISPADCYYLGIRFAVKNDTPEDLQIEHGNIIWPSAADSGRFDRTGVHGARVRDSVSVPAGLSASLQVITDDRCEGHSNNWDACLKQDFAKTGSLVLFSRGTPRYEIELPLR